MNTIEKLGDEETFRNIVERTITEFEDSEIEEIGSAAFTSCSKLTSISFPVATDTGYHAFYKCRSLTSISFPVATIIGGSAFYGCTALTSVSFPRATSIGSDAFRDCSKLSTMYIGTESDTVCTLSNTVAIPSNIDAIYVPYNLQEEYKTAPNWLAFADKIQAYDVPVLCQSLTITAEDVPWYGTYTVVHYEAVCTYSVEGMMQTGTRVFKGVAVSDTFDTNPSEESSRQVEVSYTFLGQTTTTAITQGKHLGNPVGGTIYYIDTTADGAYLFYDVGGNLMLDVSVGSTPSSYEIATPGSKDKYYVYSDKMYPSLTWSNYITTGATGTAIGTGKSNTATILAFNEVIFTGSIWKKLQEVRSTLLGGCNDWFVPSKDEVEEVRKTKLIESWFKTNIWTSSETSYTDARAWETSYWDTENKHYNSGFSVFFVRAF